MDELRHSLLKAEEDCSLERKHTLRLRRDMEQRPSHELLWELQQEKALLEARVQELEASAQVGPRGAAMGNPAALAGAPRLCHRPLVSRRRSGTRTAPTSRCWSRTGGRRCATTRSRPTPYWPCARTSVRARPSVPGYVACGAERCDGGGGTDSSSPTP